MDAILYSKYYGPHQKDATEFFNKCAGISDWCDLSKDTIMDIGCGPGTSCKWILTLFPEISKIIAIDSSVSMIELAQVLYPNPKVEYFVADVTDKSNLEVWDGKISKILSTNCCQYVIDQKECFRNAFELLKPGGEAAFLFELTSSYFDCCEDVANSRWEEYAQKSNFHTPASHARNTNFSEYKNLLEELGFEVVFCKKFEKTFEFPNDDECIGFLMALSPVRSFIPNECREDFFRDVFRFFLKRNGRNSIGQPLYRYSIIYILAKKPFRRSTSS